jgi:hypothetical protein
MLYSRLIRFTHTRLPPARCRLPIDYLISLILLLIFKYIHFDLAALQLAATTVLAMLRHSLLPLANAGRHAPHAQHHARAFMAEDASRLRFR